MKNMNFYKMTKYLLLSAMALCLLVGFKEPAEAANAKTSVKVLTVGKSYTIKNASNVTSSKKSVARVKNKGNSQFKIKALKKGKATLKVYNGKGKVKKKIYLLAANKKSFKYSTADKYLEKGQYATVKASSNISGVKIKYSSSKPKVASVDANGKITAKKAGSTKITATFYYKGIKAKTKEKTVYVYTASYDESGLNMKAGDTKTVSASVSSNCSVSYKSSDTSVATVSKTGKITAKKKGTATITATVSTLGKTLKTFTKTVTVKATSTSTGSSSSNKSTGSSSSSSSSSSGSSSAKSSSSSSSGSSSSGSTSKDVNVGDNGYVYHYGTGSKSLSGGSSGLIECYTNKDKDEFNFKLSNDCLFLNDISEGTCYDSLNECQCRYVDCSFTARIAGTCDVKIYRNGVLVRTITYTITSTDTDYYEYEDWRKGLEKELWTSDMSCYDKILTLGNYVFARYPYVANESSPYCYKDGKGGNCGASSGLLIDVAHDLGLEAEMYYVNGTSAGHMMAKITLEDGRIWLCANSATPSDTSYPYGSVYGGIYPAGTTTF